MPEYYDEVDEDDVPTGRKVTWEQSHKGGRQLHRCIAVLVFDRDGQLYVQEHKTGGRRLDHSVGGHVDAGEDYETAAYREMEEELGITGLQLQEISVGDLDICDEEIYRHMFGIYTCVAPDNWAFKPNDEVDVVYPMTLESIVDQMNRYGEEKFISGFIFTLSKYLQSVSSDLRAKRMPS